MKPTDGRRSRPRRHVAPVVLVLPGPRPMTEAELEAWAERYLDYILADEGFSPSQEPDAA